MIKCKKKIRKVVRVAFCLYSNEHTFLSIHLGVEVHSDSPFERDRLIFALLSERRVESSLKTNPSLSVSLFSTRAAELFTFGTAWLWARSRAKATRKKRLFSFAGCSGRRRVGRTESNME